jgi:hypothetical protein
MGPNHCKHYDGRAAIHDKPCRAGVDARVSFCDGETFGMFNRIPCIKTNVDAPHCHLAEFPTPEEVAASDAAFEAHLTDFMKWMPLARAAMIATKSDGGCIDCPKCKQGLRWSRSRGNGHIHAKCDTEGCLSWME